jgi:hypothetical protein
MKGEPMKKLTAALLVSALVCTGCIGSFKLTRELYHFNRSQSDKYIQELIFLPLAVFQIYTLAALGDAIVFNTIEFWAGKNPVTDNSEPRNVIVQKGQYSASMRYDPAGGTVEVTPSGGGGAVLVLSHTDEGVVARDRSGRVLFTSTRDASGGITVADANHKVIRYFTPDAVEKGTLAFFTN